MPVSASGQRGATLWGRQTAFRPEADSSSRHVLEDDNDRLIADLEQKVAILHGATAGVRCSAMIYEHRDHSSNV